METRAFCGTHGALANWHRGAISPVLIVALTAGGQRGSYIYIFLLKLAKQKILRQLRHFGTE